MYIKLLKDWLVHDEYSSNVMNYLKYAFIIYLLISLLLLNRKSPEGHNHVLPSWDLMYSFCSTLKILGKQIFVESSK